MEKLLEEQAQQLGLYSYTNINNTNGWLGTLTPLIMHPGGIAPGAGRGGRFAMTRQNEDRGQGDVQLFDDVQ